MSGKLDSGIRELREVAGRGKKDGVIYMVVAAVIMVVAPITPEWLPNEALYIFGGGLIAWIMGGGTSRLRKFFVDLGVIESRKRK